MWGYKMKKLISILLTLSIVINSVTLGIYAIGYNKIVKNEQGGETEFVGSENIEAYMKKCLEMMDQAERDYMDKYEIHPWKGNLLSWAPIIGASLFNVSILIGMKIFNAIMLKRKNIQGGDSSLSMLQGVCFGIISGASLLYGLIKSNDYSKLKQYFNAERVWEKYNRIRLLLQKRLDEPEYNTENLYGAVIECWPSAFYDKIYTNCQVYSQEYLFNQRSGEYDPKLAESIPRLSYIEGKN